MKNEAYLFCLIFMLFGFFSKAQLGGKLFYCKEIHEVLFFEVVSDTSLIVNRVSSKGINSSYLQTIVEKNKYSIQEKYSFDKVIVEIDSFFTLQNEVRLYLPWLNYLYQDRFADFPVNVFLSDTSLLLNGPIIILDNEMIEETTFESIEITYLDSPPIQINKVFQKNYSYFFRFKLFYDEDYFHWGTSCFEYRNDSIFFDSYPFTTEEKLVFIHIENIDIEILKKITQKPPSKQNCLYDVFPVLENHHKGLD